MKFLSLAYGDEKDWKVLTQEEQDALLAHDEMIRKPGEPMAAVQPAVITARAWDGNPDVSEVIRLVAKRPCARVKGAINDQDKN